jgi:hypothetical protein
MRTVVCSSDRFHQFILTFCFILVRSHTFVLNPKALLGLLGLGHCTQCLQQPQVPNLILLSLQPSAVIRFVNAPLHDCSFAALCLSSTVQSTVKSNDYFTTLCNHVTFCGD